MQLTKEQSKQFEEFISKIPVSKVRSDIERMWKDVIHSGYIIDTEQLDQLKDYSIHLPDDLQSFVQSFSHWVKNEDANVTPPEEKSPEKVDAHLEKGVASTIKKSKVEDKNIEDKTVSEFDDVDNEDAPTESHEKKAIRAKLTKEAQAGDLRTQEQPASKKDKSKEKVVDASPAAKQKEKTERLTKEAQAGDLKRTISGMQDLSATKDKTKVVVAPAKKSAKK